MESRLEKIFSMGINIMTLAVWLGQDRKCSAAVVGLDLLLGLSILPPHRRLQSNNLWVTIPSLKSNNLWVTIISLQSNNLWVTMISLQPNNLWVTILALQSNN